MTYVLFGSVGLIVAGPVGAGLAALAPAFWVRFRRRPKPEPALTVVLLLLLVELRSGLSVLAALNEVAAALPDYRSLRIVARVASVSGLTEALDHADASLRPVIAQLSRAQRSGASLSGAMRRMLDTELARDREERISRARTLPVRLMIPVTLLMLPGLILLLYAPSLLGMFDELTGALF